MENWGDCISYRRYGYPSTENQSMRSEFTRDYDKIIFLSAFRRLQNKTQVFPLPGNVFVHNRLTHSLEVASVGRSLGSIVGTRLSEQYKSKLTSDQLAFYQYELSGVISSACLAHDLGNPAFGHSGEKAISHFFIKNADNSLNGNTLKNHFSELEWKDITNFEGNANALRLLTRRFKGKLDGGQRLMYLTLASILKYPCASNETDKQFNHRKKYGYFQSDKAVFDDIILEFGLSDGSKLPSRHPFVFLVEAADDICYRIIDMEDAHRIGIISRLEIEHAFLSLLDQLTGNPQSLERTKAVLLKLTDDNEAVSYLRAKCIGGLIVRSSELFFDNMDLILGGNYNNTLLDDLESSCPYLKTINTTSINKIYNHHSVIEVELAGYNVMSEILGVFINATLSLSRTTLEKKCIELIPTQYNFANDNISDYEKTMGVLDFVSGMTDGYATELYRKMKGIEIPSHK